jgi:hypothetical protein
MVNDIRLGRWGGHVRFLRLLDTHAVNWCKPPARAEELTAVNEPKLTLLLAR